MDVDVDVNINELKDSIRKIRLILLMQIALESILVMACFDDYHRDAYILVSILMFLWILNWAYNYKKLSKQLKDQQIKILNESVKNLRKSIKIVK